MMGQELILIFEKLLWQSVQNVDIGSHFQKVCPYRLSQLILTWWFIAEEKNDTHFCTNKELEV